MIKVNILIFYYIYLFNQFIKFGIYKKFNITIANYFIFINKYIYKFNFSIKNFVSNIIIWNISIFNFSIKTNLYINIRDFYLLIFKKNSFNSNI